MSYCAHLILFLVILNLWACVPGPQGGQRLNLTPLVFYSHDAQEQTTRWELLGPLFSREQTTNTTITTLAPLFYWQTGKEVQELEFLYPLGRYRQDPVGQRFNFLPLSRSRQGPGVNEFQFFPFFWGRTADGVPYGGVFPLGGTLKERFGRESISFVLWPLFSTSRGEGSHHYHFLWPLFSYSTGRESAFTFWPLYGRITKAGVYDKYYALWPSWHYQRLNLDTDRPRTLKAVLPFYLEDTTPVSYRRGILYPFFSYYHQDQGDYTQWDLPWPVIIWGEGDQFSVRSFWPLYYRNLDQQRDRLHLLWPLYLGERDETPERFEVQHRWLLFSLYRNRVTPSGWQEEGRLWPLLYFEGRPEQFRAHAPDLLPIQTEGWDRLYGPWLYLWTLERQGTRHQGRALWGLYRWERTDSYALWELSFLASRQVTSEGSTFRLLSGLLTLERQGDTRRLRLFYLPWGLSWPR
ncbi:MAG: hypothetical protein BZ151_02450 [Desulfobacca sp. 4484_104]|nr:MAG: hypothetical protein BZ151_02450 [Desulfobacca sp. 4484_104]RLA90616.1 MAG: hypothetical protein DRG58_01550 [Deltaproteobacteria bacterium]